MAVLIAMPAELAGTSADFVHAWNSDSRSLEVAVAEVPAQEPPNYSVDLVNMVLVAFTGAGAEVTVDYIVQRLREHFSRRRPDEKITISTSHTKDGTEVTEIVVDK
jgi:hypothetical protein